MSILNNVQEEFTMIGYGLQFDTSNVPNLPGVYVIVDDHGDIRQIGKSSTNLKQRLSGFKSAVKRRNDIDEGMHVYYVAAEKIPVEIYGRKTFTYSFDAVSLKALMLQHAKHDNHSLHLGNK